MDQILSLTGRLDPGLLVGLLASSLILYITYYHFKAFSFWSSRGIKGPRPWPFLGTSVYYFLENKVDVDTKWARQYGNVYGIYQGFMPILRIHDPSLIKHIWIKNFDSFTDRNDEIIHDLTIKKWLFWSRGRHWTNQRALISPLFSSKKMKSMFVNMLEASENFKKHLTTRLGKIEQQVEKVSRDDLMSLALDVLSRSFFGLRINTYQGDKSEFNRRAFAFARFDVGYFVLWLCIPRFICRWFQIDVTRRSKYEYFDKLSQNVINERRKKVALSNAQVATPSNDIIQTLIDAKIPDMNKIQEGSTIFSKEDDIDSHYNDHIDHKQLDQIYREQAKEVTFRSFDDTEIRAQMTFFFIAGYDTTSSSLSMALYELSHNQQVQQEVYEEVREAFHNKPIDYTILMSLRKLDAMLSESMRLYAPVTEHNRTVTAKDGVWIPLEPKPIWLPHGTSISTNAFVTHRHPDLWKEPLKFDISRFYPENRDAIKSGSYSPFGLGPRNCVGMKFALTTLKVALANTLLKFKILPGPNSSEYPPKFRQHFFFLHLKDVDLILEPRV